MKDAVEIDFLIVGQGLAGSALAMRALLRNHTVMVLDAPSQNHSSRVAAGLFNPVTGRNHVKTWLADEIFPFLFRFYREAERVTGAKFFYEMPLHRPFASAAEQNEWMARSTDDSYRNYIASLSTAGNADPAIEEPFGGVTFTQTGYVSTGPYLLAVRQYLERADAYREMTFVPEELVVEKGHVRLGNIRAKKIVFCQGAQNELNPWFRNVPVKPLKGEFITIQCRWRKNVILNRGVYMVPGEHPEEWRVGSTYNWDDRSLGPTPRAREEISQRLKLFFRLPFTVTGQKWGFRPSTPDRKPVLGGHPAYPPLVIFNGLGSKGVSLAPYFSEVLIRWLENEGMIHKEADVTRFY